MKKILLLMLCIGLLLSGCSTAPKGDRITVVAAIFPEYDWARQIIGNNSDIDLRLLVDDGVDPHSYQPSVEDLVTVANCDLLIFGGGESDEWLEDTLSDSDKAVVELLPLLGERAHTAEITEGMVSREDEKETDEHVWLSLRNAAIFCEEIANALCALDPENAENYRNNLSSYLTKLSALDAAYQEAVAASEKDTILVCDRFPFRYLTEDYNLQYYAAFPGCSAESGASFSTIVFLSDKVRQLELDSVLITEGSDSRIARTVADNSGRENVQILTLDSMQAISLKDAARKDYLGIMEANLAVLKTALR